MSKLTASVKKILFPALIFLLMVFQSACKKESTIEENPAVQKSTGTVNTIDSLYINSVRADQNGKAYAATPRGLYISDDNGQSWNPAGAAVMGRDIEFTFGSSEGTLFAASGGCWPAIALVRSSDGGKNWTVSDSGGLAKQCLFSVIEKSPDLIFLATSGAGVFRSTDKGVSWKNVSTGIPTVTVQNRTSISNVWALCITSGGDILASTNHGIYKSTNNGDEWKPFGTNPSLISRNILLLSNGTILASSGSLGLMQSIDNGLTWTKLTTGLLNEVCYSMTKQPNGTLYLSGFGYAIVKSTDNGKTWTKTGWSSTTNGITSLSSCPDGRVLAGTYLGVYSSTDNGNTWTKTSP